MARSYDVHTGKLRSERAFTLKDVELETNLTDDDFSFRALGLRPGERFHDRIRDEMYVFDGKDLVAPEEFEFDIDDPMPIPEKPRK